MDATDGKKENENLELTQRLYEKSGCEEGVLFVDAFDPTRQWYQTESFGHDPGWFFS